MALTVGWLRGRPGPDPVDGPGVRHDGGPAGSVHRARPRAQHLALAHRRRGDLAWSPAQPSGSPAQPIRGRRRRAGGCRGPGIEPVSTAARPGRPDRRRPGGNRLRRRPSARRPPRRTWCRQHEQARPEGERRCSLLILLLVVVASCIVAVMPGAFPASPARRGELRCVSRPIGADPGAGGRSAPDAVDARPRREKPAAPDNAEDVRPARQQCEQCIVRDRIGARMRSASNATCRARPVAVTRISATSGSSVSLSSRTSTCNSGSGSCRSLSGTKKCSATAPDGVRATRSSAAGSSGVATAAGSEIELAASRSTTSRVLCAARTVPSKRIRCIVRSPRQDAVPSLTPNTCSAPSRGWMVSRCGAQESRNVYQSNFLRPSPSTAAQEVTGQQSFSCQTMVPMHRPR